METASCREAPPATNAQLPWPLAPSAAGPGVQNQLTQLFGRETARVVARSLRIDRGGDVGDKLSFDAGFAEAGGEAEAPKHGGDS